MSIQYFDLPNGDRRVTDDGRDVGVIKATASPEALAGLQPWSQHKHPVLIFSVAQAGLSKLWNRHEHNVTALALTAERVPFDSAEGCYKGSRERCFIINCDSRKGYEKIARAIAEQYAQESVLYITPDRDAQLQKPDGVRIACLGKLRVVSRVIAERARAYTFANGCYYVAGG